MSGLHFFQATLHTFVPTVKFAYLFFKEYKNIALETNGLRYYMYYMSCLKNFQTDNIKKENKKGTKQSNDYLHSHLLVFHFFVH